MQLTRLMAAALRAWLGMCPLVSFVALALCAWGCNSAALGVGPTRDGGDGSSSESTDAVIGDGSVAKDATAEITGTLVLQLFDGDPPGRVVVQVPQAAGVAPVVTCTSLLSAGACQLTSCELGGSGNGGPGPPSNLGPVFATIGTTTLPVTYTGLSYGTAQFPQSVTLGTGDTVRFQGEDATGVPAFDVSVTVPGLAVITSPVQPSSGSDAIVSTSQDLSVTWLPISIGQVHFQMEAPLGGGGITALCTFQGASGVGAVPQMLLSSMKEMAGAGAVSAALTSELDATIVVDGLTIITQSYQTSKTVSSYFSVKLE